MTLYSIGYEGINIERFIRLLKSQKVQVVVDVRELPLSRKQGFSKNALAALLKVAGVEYLHIPALGCPKVIRDQYKVDGDWKRYTVAFNRYLKTQGEAIAELVALASDTTCCLVCFEADYSLCHRSLVAVEAARESDLRIKHIDIRTGLAAPGLPAFA